MHRFHARFTILLPILYIFNCPIDTLGAEPEYAPVKAELIKMRDGLGNVVSRP